MNRIILLYNKKASETKDKLVQVAREKFNTELIPVNNSENLRNYPSNIPILKYGLGTGFDLDKDEQAILFEDIIPNTLINDVDEIGDYDTVVVKNPYTTLMLGKDYKKLDDDIPVYKYIQNKSEWRINYSFGKINSIYNKNLTPSTIFGKADITQWEYEKDKKIRGQLIKYIEGIVQVLRDEEYTEVEHFGVDIIRDNTTGQFYFLELNLAHALNEENCFFFLRGYFEKKNIPTQSINIATSPVNNTVTVTLTVEQRNLLRQVLGL